MRHIPVDEWGDPAVRYDDLVREALGEWVSKATFGSYQGDYLYIFRNNDQVGYLVVGYGSCSACDWLQGLVGYSRWDERSVEDRNELRSELDRMVARLKTEVRWFDSADELIDSVWGDANYWFTHERDFQDSMNKALGR